MDAATLSQLTDSELQDWLGSIPISPGLEFVQEMKALAEEVNEMGSFQRACKILECTGARADLVLDPRGQAILWRGWANVYQRHNQFEDSLAASERSALIFKDLGDEREMAISRILEVFCLGIMGRYQEAEQLAVDLVSVLHDFPLGLAFIYDNLAQTYSAAWRLEDALKAYQQAEGLFQTLGRSDLAASTALDMGVLSEQLDQLPAARDYFDQAFTLAAAEQDNYLALKSRYNLAGLYSRQEQLNLALPCIHQASRIATQLDDPAEMGYVSLEEARVRLGLGQRDQAQELLLQALKCFENPGFVLDKVVVLSELARIFSENAGTDGLMRSLDYLKQAQDLLASQPVEVTKAFVACEQAELLLRLERFSEAIDHLHYAQAVFEKVGLPLRQAWIEADLGMCYWDTDPARAELHFKRSFERGAARIPKFAVRSWHGLARCAATAGDLDHAISYFKSALENVNQTRRLLSSHAQQAGFSAGKEDLVKELLKVLLDRQGSPGEILDWVERSKAWALADLLANHPASLDTQSKAYDLYREREHLQRELDWKTNQLIGISRQSNGPIHQTRASQESCEALTSASIAVLRKQLQVTQEKIDLFSGYTTTWQEDQALPNIHALLNPESVYISYAVVEGRLVVLTVTDAPGDIQVQTLDTTLAEVEHHLAFLRSGLGQGDQLSAAKITPRLAWFYRKLLAPVEERLCGKSHLIISPVGSLALLPFAAFQIETGQWLVEKWACSLIPSAVVWAALQKAPCLTQSPLWVGYPGTAGEPGYLFGVKKELEALSHLFPDACQIYGEDAAFEQVMDSTPASTLIHLAGHAWYDETNPLESGMPLAGGRWLRAADLYLHKNRLPGSLVVLSGCETGLGKLLGGEVLGLNSAFLYAGASGVISGLWKVEDSATAQLFESFYRWLKETNVPEIALRQAQLDLLHTPATSHPYFWAAFCYTGS